MSQLKKRSALLNISDEGLEALLRKTGAKTFNSAIHKLVEEALSGVQSSGGTVPAAPGQSAVEAKLDLIHRDLIKVGSGVAKIIKEKAGTP